MTAFTAKVGSQYTFTNSDKPTTPFGSRTPGFVKASDEYSWVQIGLGAAADAVRLATAELRIPLAADIGSGTRTFTAQRADAAWKVRQITDENKPGVTGTSSATGTIGAEDAGYLLVFDVKADTQAFLDAGRRSHPGWRIQTSDGTRRRLDLSAAELFLRFSKAGSAPTALKPNGHLVSVSKFSVGWQASLDMVDFQVQVGPTGFVSPTLDTGWLPFTPETSHVLDLADTAYGGLSSGSTYWRVRGRNEDNEESPWSQEAAVTRDTRGTVTIVQPTSTVWESTPPHEVTMTGMIGLSVTVDDLTAGKANVFSIDLNTTSPGEFTPEKPVYKQEGHQYRVTARPRDGKNWSPLETRSQAVLVTTADLDPDVDPTSWVSVQQPGPDPWVDVIWSRAVMPDGFRVFRDGVDLTGTLPALDLEVAGTTTYTWRDYTAAPNVPHEWRVRPVVDGKTGSGNPAVEATVAATGLWLVYPDEGWRFCLHGEGTAAILTPTGEDEATETRIGDRIIRRVSSIVGPVTGSVSGVLSQRTSGRAWDVQEADLWAMRGLPQSTTFRLVQGVTNAPVTVGSLIAYDVESTLPPHNTRRGARFTVNQDGELPFDRPAR